MMDVCCALPWSPAFPLAWPWPWPYPCTCAPTPPALLPIILVADDDVCVDGIDAANTRASFNILEALNGVAVTHIILYYIIYMSRPTTTSAITPQQQQHRRTCQYYIANSQPIISFDSCIVVAAVTHVATRTPPSTSHSISRRCLILETALIFSHTTFIYLI